MARRRRTIRVGGTVSERRTKTAGEPEGGESVTPVIIDAGKKSRASIRRLKEGRGRLMLEVSDIIEDARGTSAAANKEIVPVVILYRERPRRRARMSLPLIPSPLNLFR
jgi:Family of unknown function (DUF6200)